MDDAGGKHYNVAGKFGVNGYPTNYLIDSNGKIAFRSIGYDESGLRAALAKLGVK
jgi:hypothetical protein